MKNCLNKLIVFSIVLISLYLFYIHYVKQINIETFDICSNDMSFGGNPQLLRDGSNLKYNPSLESGVDIKNAILGYESSGWDGRLNNELTIDFKNPTDIKGIIIGGYGTFSIQVKVLNDSTKIPHWTNLHDTNKTGEQSKIFTGGNTEIGYAIQSKSSCYNLNVNNSPNFICSAIKFKVVAVPRVKAQFEIYGIDADASPGYNQSELINTHATVYNENNKVIRKEADNLIVWTGERDNSDPHLIVKFNSTDTVPINNKLIHYVDFYPNQNTWITSYNISYKYKGSNITRHVSNIIGNSGPNGETRYYFKYPILVSEMTIKPTSENSFDSNMNIATRPSCKVKIYGKVIENTSEENTIIAEQETYHQINKSKGQQSTCPPIGQLINKQAEIQQLCDALEQTDEIEYEKKKIDSNKTYQLKLARQKKEIGKLQSKIQSMRTANKQFNNIEDRNKMAMFKYQEELDDKLKKLVQTRLGKQSAINFNVAVKNPESTSTNTVESFANNLSQRFKTRQNKKIPSEKFYEEFIGSYYFN
jgi:hypothetical protein